MTSTYEQRVLDWLRKTLLEQDPDIGWGDKRITVEDVQLEQAGGEKRIIILFREARRLQCLFGLRSHPSYFEGNAANETYAVGAAQEIYSSLKELIEAADMGLPEDCADNSITWV